jgi:hypothetical protein
MNINKQLLTSVMSGEASNIKQWQGELQQIVATKDLQGQRLAINRFVTEQKITLLDCAAALLYLNKNKQQEASRTNNNLNENSKEAMPPSPPPTIKLVRYRLDLGSQHQVNLAVLKKVIVEESGVDINNIFNVRIQDSYTLVDLPDEMPQEIFHHLKTVEINGKKLDIRRVKPRNKKHSAYRRKAHRSSGVATVKKANI